MVQQVEHVQLHRGVLHQPGGGPPDVHPGLQRPEVGPAVAQRHDLPVQDHGAPTRPASTASSG